MGKHLNKAALTGVLGCWLTLAGWSGVVAEEAASPAGLSVELNNLQQVDTSCRVVFLVENRLSGDLTGISFETVLINRAGVVDRLTVFDFKEPPKGQEAIRRQARRVRETLNPGTPKQ